MNKAYNPIDWKNEPNTSTPINETNLNKMDRAIDTIDNRVIDLDNGKVNKEDGKSLVSNTDIPKIGANETAIQAHISDKSNPHSVTKSQVGLGNADNTSDANKPVSTAQATAIADAKKAGTDAQTNLNTHTSNKSNPHSVTKAQVGLGNVDNTRDADKPISTAQQAEFDSINNNLSQLEIDLKMLGYTVPKEMPVQNYVDADGVFHQRVGRVDLGSLDWIYATNPNRFNADFKDVKFNDNDTPIIAYSSIFTVRSFNDAILVKDKCISVYGGDGAAITLVAMNDSYTDAITFKQAMQGVYLYYELAEENTIKVDGNEAVTKINESLANYGLLNKFDGKWEQGLIDYQSGEDKSSTSSVRTPTFYNVDNNGFVSIEVSETYAWIGFRFFDVNKNYIKEESVQNATKLESKAPSNAKYVRFVLQEGYDFTPSNVGKTIIYIDNEIDKLKSDLSAYADGTKAVAKATTAESATKATQDGNGNIIADTYLRKTDSTNVLLPIGSMIMCNAEQISQYYGTWVDLGTTTITCTTGTGEDIMDVTYTIHVFSRTA